jgi:hypothetical protein
MSKRRPQPPEPLPDHVSGGLLGLAKHAGKSAEPAGGWAFQQALWQQLGGLSDDEARLAIAEARAERAEHLLKLLEAERGVSIDEMAENAARQIQAILRLAASDPAGSA